MLANLLIGTLVAFILLLLIAVPFVAMRDAKQKRAAQPFKPEDPPYIPHPLKWLVLALLSLLLAGIGGWHFLHPGELLSGGKLLTVVAGLAYLAMGPNGPGIAWLAVAAGCLAAAIWHYRARH